MTEEYNESTRVMPAAGEPPIDRTMVATAPPPAGATQMGGTLTCPVCATTNPGLETYCVECGFLLASAPGAVEASAEPEGEAIELVESASGRRFRLRPGVNTVGRENCDILLLDGTVSRRHAEVLLEGDSVTVTDLGSTNGTQVDGNRISANQPAQIQPGTIIRFGNATLTLPGAAEAAPAEPTIVAGGDFEQTIVGAPQAAAESTETAMEPAAESESDAAAVLRGTAGAANIMLRAGTITIGRRPGNDVVLADAYVSGQHASISCTDTGCILTDLGSTNGTTVNGSRLEANSPQTLVDGDEVQIGQSNYRFETVEPRAEEELPETPESEVEAPAEPDEDLSQ